MGETGNRKNGDFTHTTYRSRITIVSYRGDNTLGYIIVTSYGISHQDSRPKITPIKTEFGVSLTREYPSYSSRHRTPTHFQDLDSSLMKVYEGSSRVSPVHMKEPRGPRI